MVVFSRGETVAGIMTWRARRGGSACQMCLLDSSF